MHFGTGGTGTRIDGHTSPRAPKAMSSTYRGKFIPGRPHRPFPVLLRPADEAEGAAILRELPNASGMMLFGALRDVMLWLLAPQGERGSLFPESSERLRREKIEGGEVEPHLFPFLLRMAAMTEVAETHSQAEVGALCAEIAMWAGANDLPHTELAFTQACAIAQPKVLIHALRTARLARDLGQFPRADTWFRHTIKLARSLMMWDTHVDGMLGLGTCYLRAGNGPAARAMYERALKGAKRWRLRTLEGAAHHDLFHVCVDAGEIRHAYEHANSARVAYGKLESYLLRLAADLASLWVHLGNYARAVPIYQAIIDRAPNKTIKALRCANLVRAAAFSGFRDTYESARARALSAILDATDPVRVAECFAIIAISDNAMGEWDRATVAANEALRRAIAVGANEVELKAGEALSLAQNRRLDQEETLETFETPGLARFADTLALDLTRTIVP